MTHNPRRLLALALAAAAFTLPAGVQTALAGAAPSGTVLVAGADWAGTTAAMGDLNVYSNGPTFTGFYQCTELAFRWAVVAYGESRSWPVGSAAGMWAAGPAMPVPFRQLGNGAGTPPQFGDMVVFGATAAFPQGHVVVVSGTHPGYVDVVEENGSSTGRAALPISGTTMPPRVGSNQPVIGWLRAAGAAYVPDPSAPGGQVLDAWGGVHPFGSAVPVASPAYWPGWNIARDIVTVAAHPNSGYTLDGWGGIHPFGTAPAVTGSAYWAGWDIARALALRPDGHSGYVLDGWGGLHPFGTVGDVPPAVTTSAYWAGWDIARSLVLRSDGVSGYVLDGFGGLQPFAASPGAMPNAHSTVYWAGWNIARGIALASDDGGYVLDGFGGVHAFGTAAAATASTYSNGTDLARGLVVTGPGAGYVLFLGGGVRSFGNAPAVNVGALGSTPGRAIG